MRTVVLGISLALSFLSLAPSCQGSPPDRREALIAAAASMRVVLPELTHRYETSHPATKLVVSYGSSGELRKQVEGGAPVDGLIFASGKPVDDLITKGLVDAAARRVIASNTLVLIRSSSSEEARASSSPRPAAALTFATLGSLPATETLAIGDPGAVPAGLYAREVLEKSGAWAALQGHLVLGSDVAAVLAYARRGEVAAAIVYRTDIQGINDVTVLDEAKGPDAPRIEIVAASVEGSANEATARSFVEFLASPEAQEALRARGFGPPPPASK